MHKLECFAALHLHVICRHDGFCANACVRGLFSSPDNYFFSHVHKLKVEPEYIIDFCLNFK